MDLIIPKKQTRVILDSQILTTLQLCEVMVDFRFNLNLVPKSGPGKSIEKGSMMHHMLEAYYRAQRDGKKKIDAIADAITMGQLFKQGCPDCIKKQCKIHKRNEIIGLQSIDLDEAHEVMDTFQEYIQFWKNDSWTTVDVETVMGEVIYEDDEISLMWKAKVDWLVDNLEGIFSVDHKTASRKEEVISLDNQFIGQAVVTKQTKMFRNVIGFQTSLKPPDKYIREAVNFSKERITEWILETASYAYDLIHLHESKRYRHRFTSCRRRYGDCIYRKVCEGQPDDRQRLIDEQFKEAENWDINND